MSIKHLESLDIWILSNDLTDKIYDISSLFPVSKQFGLTSQIRRSVSSIASNITEGHSRMYVKEFIRFLHIAKGSLAETFNHLHQANRLKFISHSTFVEINNDIRKLESKLIGYINYQSTKL